MSYLRQLEHLRIPLNDIKSATNHFSNQNFIGIGGFGKVYKGELSISEGLMTVAVKRLDPEHRSGQGQREFLMEITMLSRYQHENIVSLLGFCDENDEKILVYKHMFHGSLDKYLRSTSLSWCQWLRICCGAARGLLYLHYPDGGLQRVLHRDIKSSNILLDETWEAKISDFGLSKIGPANQQFTFLVSNAVGTIGYCDPVYVETGILTKESDVYSFGVVLFEVLCGKLCTENYNDGRGFLGQLAQQSYEKDKLDDIIKDNMKEEMEPDSLVTFSAIAYRCLRNDPEERPTMAEVVDELETALKYQENREANVVHIEGYRARRLDYRSVLSALNQYRLRLIAELSDGGLPRSNYVSSIEFDREDEFVATAGSSRCIKVFDFSMIASESLEMHLPVVEMSNSSTISCLSWNKDTRNHLASSDLEGTVTVWDVNSHQRVMEYKEHEDEAWSVDFSCVEPSMLVSAGFDKKVKVWCMNQEASSININMTEPTACAKYHPGSSMHIVVASRDTHSYYYDLRNTSHPVHIFRGHRKAVTCLRFLSNDKLVTASWDGTLRLWDLNRNLTLRTFKGHTSAEYFMRISVKDDFIACGSETNEVFVYHKAFSKPLTWQQCDSIYGEENTGYGFVNAVCWKSDSPSPTLLVGNTNETVKVFVLET